MRLPATLTMMLIVPFATASEVADDLRDKGYTASTVTPVFSQLVAMSYPRDFAIAFESAKGADYIQNHVLKGETVEKWTQMISLTGIKGEAADPRHTPAAVLQVIANAGFRDKCPDSFVWKALGKMDVSGHEGYVALLGCGTFPAETPYSEIAIIIAARGAKDIYTIQWAERGAATRQPPVLDESRWKARFQQLLPIRICDRVPGEAPPYPSCISRPAAQ
jgi:hypothetical protein